jgi:hypothetical protein
MNLLQLVRRTLVLGLLPFVIGCSSYETAYLRDVAAAAEPGMVAAGGSTSTQRMLIRTASLSLAVDDIEETIVAATQLVERSGGYVESSEGGDTSGYATLRVPAAQLEKMLDALAELGDERRRELGAEDVTEQLADIETTLKNKRALRDRLRALLERASAVKEVLEVEEQLVRIQTEVEQLEGRQQRLQQQVALATIRLSLERPPLLGPLGYVGYGLWWCLKKLFVIRD